MTSPTQRERVATLTTLTKGRLASLQEAISAKDTDEEDDAIDKILTSRNTVSKQDVQSVLQDIEHEEQQQLAHHDAAATTHARNMRQWTISVSALSVLFVALVGVLLNRDVFRRRRAEAELRESEARYRTLVENANEGIIAITVEGKISAINHGLETMLDWSREELLGKSYGEILTPASAAQSEERLRHALAVERLPSTYEVETVRKDGSIVPVEVRADFLRDAAGHIMGLLALHRDVSIRKVLEQA
jgi:PAS domain S-box-containing protein